MSDVSVHVVCNEMFVYNTAALMWFLHAKLVNWINDSQMFTLFPTYLNVFCDKL